MVNCISLFSGAGGLDVGATMAGAKVTVCVEIDKDSSETLRLNDKTKTIEVFASDVTEVDFKVFRSTADRQILIGGPPCQPFSKNGYWVKNENRLIERDPRNMLSQFLRAVSEAQPNGFLFENVESLLHPSNKETLRLFLESAESLGYRCTMYRANAADFGIPQLRKRVFVFGVRGINAPIPAPKPTHSAKSDIDGLLPHEGVGKFINGFDRPQFFEPSEIASEGTYFPELLNVPAGKNYIALANVAGHQGKTFRSGSRFWNFLYKLHPDLPSITIAALQFVHHKLAELESDAGFCLPNVGMVQQDFLQWSATTKSSNVIFVGNPPFVTNQRGARWRNMYADFVEAMLNYQSASVSFSLILPVSVCFSRDYADLRRQIEQSGMGISAASYDNIPDCLFKAGKPESQNTNRANSQRCTILHVGGRDCSVRESSPMIRWTAGNRSEVLRALPSYYDYSNYVFDKQIPRPSTDWMLKYLSENKSSPTLKSHMTRHAKCDFSVGAVARNFIGIREPSVGDATSIAIKAETELDRMVLLQILGSSIFFEYWRSLGDGFHVTSDLIERFPISERLYKCCLANISSAKHQWNNRTQVLKEKLNSGRVVRTFDFTGRFNYLEI